MRKPGHRVTGSCMQRLTEASTPTGIPLRVCNLEAAPGARLEARDPHEALAIGVLQFLHDHGHSRDDRAQGQGEAPRSADALLVTDAVQPGFLDLVAFTRVAELSASFVIRTW